MMDDEDLYAHVDAVCAVPLTDDEVRAHYNSWAAWRRSWLPSMGPDDPIPPDIRMEAEMARRIHALIGGLTFEFREDTEHG